MHRRIAILIPLLLAACSSASGSSDARAVATVYPLGWLVGEIAPDLEVASLATGGQDAHDLELTPQQRGDIERASLVVYPGELGLQPQVEAAIAASRGEVVSAAEVVGADALLTDDHGDTDPHFWFDPSLMAKVATAVGEAAGRTNPDRADEYAQNAEQIAAELGELAGEIEQTLSNCAHDQVVVGHEAYAYLLTPYGLEQRGISPPGEHAEASPQDIATLAEEVRDQGLPAVLSEPVEGRRDAEAVARESGAELVEIYSLDIVDEEQAAKGYPALLREQADAVATAADCVQ